MNPGTFLRGLRSAVLASPVRLFEQSKVVDIIRSNGGVNVKTARGVVRAEKVVLATNAYAGEWDITPKRLSSPMWVTEVETEPIAPERLAALGWASRSGLITQHNIMENYRLTSRHTIVFGVRQIERATNYPLPERRPDPAVVADLARAFARRFPPLADVAIAHAWGGWIGITSTWLPVAGTVGDDVYYSLACNGHGLAQATYIGSLIADRRGSCECGRPRAPRRPSRRSPAASCAALPEHRSADERPPRLAVVPRSAEFPEPKATMDNLPNSASSGVLSSRDWRSITGMAAVIQALNVTGWGVLGFVVAPHHYALGATGVFGVGPGVTAFTLGMRHAFDADHIAAIDNTTQKLLAEGQRPLAVGFWFSLGHSTVAFLLCLLLSLGIRAHAPRRFRRSRTGIAAEQARISDSVSTQPPRSGCSCLPPGRRRFPCPGTRSCCCRSCSRPG
ncbi:hypothetical protein Amsp01_043750 [Amycolatopsis sp. NBRC 101858]|uniref:FAD-dependent oxidoreductase n=1 Tax=Amycolatopsis sp. NBRC 101858 TaxID=3032200 RepID=UPI0024A5A763|nr:FAD-dependent oxidoreductase [Amycolatopsis sp. NBRC 101858]GLY38351.1 hypothetical protein Amsp01_043750 [Amycolatopsis sp. NBRC 101858]